MRLAIFVEALWRTYESRGRSSLSVDDASTLNELVTWRNPKQLFSLPERHVTFLQTVMKEFTVRQYFGSLDDTGGLLFLSEVIKDYSAMAQVYQERAQMGAESMRSLTAFLAKCHCGLPREYLEEVSKSPSTFCVRPLIVFACKGLEHACFLKDSLHKFQH